MTAWHAGLEMASLLDSEGRRVFNRLVSNAKIVEESEEVSWACGHVRLGAGIWPRVKS